MKTGLVVVVAFFVIIGVLGVSLVVAELGFYNTSVKMEAGIKAQYDQNKNNYDNYFKKLKEAAQVPDMYIEDMQKLWGQVVAGRYGKDGSRAMFNWIKEHNPTVDAALYKKVQDIVESGRNSFEADQKMLIDKKREYFDTHLKTVPNNVFAGVLGFPKINQADYAIVTSTETEEVFKYKKSEPMKLRENK